MEKSSGEVLVLAILLAVALQGVSQAVTCYTATNCGGGSTTPAADFRECCLGPGLSYNDGVRCRPCVANCDELMNPAFGNVTITGTTPGSVATYMCNPGYVLVGTMTRICEQVDADTADWTLEAPICEAICDELMNPDFGTVTITGTTSGSTATYMCNSGYVLVGTMTRTCVQLDATTADWDLEAPICERAISMAIESTGTTSLTISWTLVVGTMVNGFGISYSNTDTQCFTDSHTVSNIAAGKTSHTLTDLEEGTEYIITVTTLSTGGRTDEDSIAATTLEAAPSAPPTSVSTSDVTSSSITVQWGEVDCVHHNGDITGYSVRYGVQGSGGTQIVSVSGGAITEATISGLVPSTNYEIGVAAVNSAGTGVYNNVVIVKTSKLSSEVTQVNTAAIVGGGIVLVVTIAVTIIVVVALLRLRCCLPARNPVQEPISSVDVPTSTNEAYELRKQAEEGGKEEEKKGVIAQGRGRGEVYEYELVSAPPPAQPVAADEDVYEHIP